MKLIVVSTPATRAVVKVTVVVVLSEKVTNTLVGLNASAAVTEGTAVRLSTA
ncbi:hypothetical protein D3C76_1667550 [compost metagenome]